MIINKSNLSDQEKEALIEAIANITILIAGADGKIDKDELQWAEKITEIRSYSLPDELKNYYTEVGKDFSERLEGLIDTLPGDVSERSKILTEKLSNLNPILAKLEKRQAVELYRSFLSFAKHVAKSNGGFLGFFRVSYEESQFMDLPMIDPIELEEEA